MSDQANALNRALREGGVAPPEAPGAPADGQLTMPGIQLPTLELPREGRRMEAFAREAGQIAKMNGVFRREQIPVTIDKEEGIMVAMLPYRFLTYIEDLAMTHKTKADGEDADGNKRYRKVPCTMKVETARATLASDQFIKQQRKLSRINTVRQPVIRADGKIELLPEGYDAGSEVFTMKSDVVIDETWTLDKARTFLIEMYKEFPFAEKAEDGTSRSLAVHISGMLGLFGFGLQPITAPRLNFVYTANSAGSGKTLLVQAVVIPVMGRCQIQTIPDQPAELKKILDSAALGSVPYLFFDEVEGNVKNKDLNAFITAPYWTGRAFNTQTMFTCPKQTICYLAGNNLTLTPDIQRRTLQASLYVEQADVQAREIEKVIDEAYLAKATTRGDILSALWAMIRSWDKADRPTGTTQHRGFEAWSKIFGGIVEHAGFGNPLAAPSEGQELDSESADIQALVTALAVPLGTITETTKEPIKEIEYTFAGVIEKCLELNCFTWMIDGKWKTEKVDGHESDKYFESSPKTASCMGRMLSGKFGGRLFVLKDAEGKRRLVRFGTRGRDRTKRYKVKLEA